MNKIEIYCPKCGNKVITYDGQTTINIISKCKNCKRMVVYHVDSGVVELKRLPQRETSSGMTFM